MKKEDYYALIMAGGGGTRLWPLSRKSRPKQSLKLFGDRTLFQVAVDRILPMFGGDSIYILTIAEQAALLRPQAPDIPAGNFLLEPCPRGTASVIGLAAVHLRKRNPASVMACLTADHYIRAEGRFRSLLSAAYEAAAAGHLVTLGIRPEYPDTGYGYIHMGDGMGDYEGLPVYEARAFREKPDLETAGAYLESGEYAWNSGMFVWRVDRILDEMERQMPELYAGLMEIESALGTGDEMHVTRSVWDRLASVTIDYGVMEGAAGVVVFPAGDLGWLDVGDWNRLYSIKDTDADFNAIEVAQSIGVDTRGCLIIQDREQRGQRLIATAGLEDIVIIDTADALLVCKRSEAGQVKQIVDMILESGNEEYL
jgi:mannose-1-phosphate guanylyltransferase